MRNLSMGMFYPILALIKATFREWSADRAPRLGAALAFYSMLSLGPLLLIAIAMVGIFYGEAAAQGQIVIQIRELVGTQGAEAIQQMIAASHKTNSNIIAGGIGALTLLVSASGVFGELQDALNTIWHVKPPKENSISQYIKVRIFSFTMVLGIGFLLIVSLIMTAVLTGISTYVSSILPIAAPFMFLLDFLVTFGVISFLFTLIFKVIPDVALKWKDVWAAGVLTGILFTAGKFLIGIYLGHSAIASVYGAAGSLIVLLIWIYYSAQILYFGAEFSKVYSSTFGSRADASKPTLKRHSLPNAG